MREHYNQFNKNVHLQTKTKEANSFRKWHKDYYTILLENRRIHFQKRYEYRRLQIKMENISNPYAVMREKK